MDKKRSSGVRERPREQSKRLFVLLDQIVIIVGPPTAQRGFGRSLALFKSFSRDGHQRKRGAQGKIGLFLSCGAAFN